MTVVGDVGMIAPSNRGIHGRAVRTWSMRVAAYFLRAVDEDANDPVH
jgi:hypothetical protein